MGTGNTVKKADGDRQGTAVVAVSEILTRLMSLAFSLSFLYDFFYHPHLLSLAAIVPAWKWWNTYLSHPTSPPLHDSFYVMISVTFKREENANWPFLLKVGVAGDGSTTTNIKMNTKWLSLAAIIPVW
jgi:hypothetical protein